MAWMFSRIGSKFLTAGLTATLIATLGLTACTAPVQENSKRSVSAMSKSVLRVGLTANYPPLVEKTNGQLAGIEIDLADQVGKDLNKRMEFVEMPWDELIPALADGDIDVIMSGMSITEGRKKKISFTDPYMQIGQMAITRIDEIQKLGSLSALLNAPITAGFEADTTGELFVKNNMHNAKPQPVDSIDAAIAALRSRQIDVFIHDAPTAWRIGSDAAYKDLIGLYWPLTDEFLAWGVPISDQALRTALNGQIAAMKKDGRLARITRKWIKVRVEVK
jgi:ABC-type amino acid transport substrate-binding protein